MIMNSCPRCGSLNLVADRALAGRIICANCGTPVSGSSFIKSNTIFNLNKANKRNIIFLAILIFVLVIII